MFALLSSSLELFSTLWFTTKLICHRISRTEMFCKYVAILNLIRSLRQTCAWESQNVQAGNGNLQLTRVAKTLRLLKLGRLLKVVRSFRCEATSYFSHHFIFDFACSESLVICRLSLCSPNSRLLNIPYEPSRGFAWISSAAGWPIFNIPPLSAAHKSRPASCSVAWFLLVERRGSTIFEHLDLPPSTQRLLKLLLALITSIHLFACFYWRVKVRQISVLSII